MRRPGRRVSLGLAAFAALLLFRWAVEPSPAPWPRPTLDPAARQALRARLAGTLLDETALAGRLATTEVLLVGEDHFWNEPPAYLARLLDALHRADGRPQVLLLELPRGLQAALDRHRETGADGPLDEAWRAHPSALPLRSLVAWARPRAAQVREVRAVDESPTHIVAMRALRTDTRNETMAGAVLDARACHPGALVVLYGGSGHMGRAGRYLYDLPSRVPVGARLLARGLLPRALTTLWLAADRGALAGAFPGTGAAPLAGPLGDLPLPVLTTLPILGVASAREVVDYAVALGPLTPVAGAR